MKISNVEVIEFRTTVQHESTRWGYGVYLGETAPRQAVTALTKISTDEGVDGYMLGGDRAMVEVVKPLLLGEDPLDRERLWHWMDQLVTFSHRLSEGQAGIVDCALWDLAGRMTGLPVSKLLGGVRERVRAYASTAPNLGGPEVYAEHVRTCRRQGYRAYKVHAYICWNPHTSAPAPQLPGFPREDVEICRAVREAAGDDLVLMHDPFGVYTLEESLWAGRELEKLDYYWLEHPMIETRVEAYRRLTRELAIAILAPEHVPGGPFARAEWALQGASDMLRIDVNYGGITGCWKLINLCQLYGLKCELHGTGWAHLQLLGATPEATCLYYERGLLRPGLDDPLAAPYLKSIPDPLDDDGNVVISPRPGLGLDLNWDYIDEHRIP
ncbi:MAG TPA: enolase C-terminal domain-like protein [Chloroflexota bacterium]|jgi:L-alanine-DL-glutamate epimerase-like enolase superfamily enzyme